MRRRSPARRNLRWQLTVWVGAVLLMCAAVMFVAIYRATGSKLRSQIDRDVAGDARQLEQSVAPLAGQPPSEVALAATRYMDAQPFTATSTLLFVLVPGARPASNHPELFGVTRPDDRESAAQQAQENALGRQLLVPHIGYSTRRVPDVGDVRIYERRVAVGSLRVIVSAGEALASVTQAERSIASTFVLAGSLIFAIALLASYLAGARVSAPLRRMAAIARRVDAGELNPRMAYTRGPRDEVGVLAEAFNHMLDRLADAFVGQREFIGDASHELRTPLTVIRGQLEVLAAQPNPSPEEVRRVERLVQAEIERMSRLVDDLLLLAQSEQADFLRLKPIDLATFVEDLWTGVTLTGQRRFELGPVPPGTLIADPDRLAQILRNLTRNAIDHTHPPDGLVRLELERSGRDRIRFAVIDDGPGIPRTERERVFERFHRLDASRTRAAGGAGLGLAIVAAIAEAHGGRATADARADRPGACMQVELPGFTPTTPMSNSGARAGDPRPVGGRQ